MTASKKMIQFMSESSSRGFDPLLRGFPTNWTLADQQDGFQIPYCEFKVTRMAWAL
jgi:hypothetical protein